MISAAKTSLACALGVREGLAARRFETVADERLAGIDCADYRKRLVSLDGDVCGSIDASTAIDNACQYQVSYRLIWIRAAARENASDR